MKTLREIGEKELINKIIKPLFNPNNILNSIGDDCAIIESENGDVVCFSTDRIPHDLIALRLGLINYYELGYYLAVLNISDVVASGIRPYSLLLNLALPSEFLLIDFKNLLKGIKDAAEDYNVDIIGGDLSSSPVISLSATSIGKGKKNELFYRKGCQVGDLIYCCDYLGLTSTSFYYFLEAKPKGLSLNNEEENLLIKQFKKPQLRVKAAKFLNRNFKRVTAMDNTDGIGQSFSELSQINNYAYVLNIEALPIHSITQKIGEFLNISPIDIALGSGADFQLIGTIENKKLLSKDIKIIGKVNEGQGVFIKNEKGKLTKCKIKGWNYYDSYR